MTLVAATTHSPAGDGSEFLAAHAVASAIGMLRAASAGMSQNF